MSVRSTGSHQNVRSEGILEPVTLPLWLQHRPHQESASRIQDHPIQTIPTRAEPAPRRRKTSLGLGWTAFVIERRTHECGRQTHSKQCELKREGRGEEDRGKEGGATHRCNALGIPRTKHVPSQREIGDPRSDEVIQGTGGIAEMCGKREKRTRFQ